MSESEVINFKKICKEDSVVLAILGASGSGKTTMLKHILSETRKIYTNIFLFQGSMPSEDNVYTNYIWPADIYYEKSPNDKMSLNNISNTIDNYVKTIIDINNNIKDLKKKNNKTNIPSIKTLFIFDDFGENNRHFADVTNISRHSYVSFIFLIHNDTDLHKSLRNKVTHYLINVNFSLNQILDNFKSIKNEYEHIRKKFIEQNKTRCFLLIAKENLNRIDYCSLTKEEVDKIRKKNNVVFYKHSKQRNILKDFIMDIYNEEIKKKDTPL